MAAAFHTAYAGQPNDQTKPVWVYEGQVLISFYEKMINLAGEGKAMDLLSIWMAAKHSDAISHSTFLAACGFDRCMVHWARNQLNGSQRMGFIPVDAWASFVSHFYLWSGWWDQRHPKILDYMKLGGSIDLLDSGKDLARIGLWTERNHWHSARLSAESHTWIITWRSGIGLRRREGCPTEKDLTVLLDWWASSVPAWPRRPTESWPASEIMWPARAGR